MTKYIHVPESRVPVGKSALWLFVHRDQLCAGRIERRCDGRLMRHMSNEPSPAQLMVVICDLMAAQGADADLYVVIDADAYWPDAFPSLDTHITKLNRF